MQDNIENILKSKIDKNTDTKSISFKDYMETVLYYPKLGYYSGDNTIFGKNGDFITAPEIGNIFAKSLFKTIYKYIQKQTTPYILELGAGTGKLCYQLINEAKNHNLTLAGYKILEISPSLKIKQQKYLKSKLPDFYDKIQWLDDFPQNLTGAIIANEVIDALPATIFKKEDNLLYEIQVEYKNNNFSWKKIPANNKIISAINNIENNNLVIPNNYQSEIILELNDFLTKINNSLKKGIIFFADYGFLAHELYHPDRNTGTLMCHSKHKCHNDPFHLPGKQDITVHINFTEVKNILINQGLRCLDYSNLSSFIIYSNVLESIDFSQYKIQNEINLLTSPAEMGEIFKTISFIK